MAIQAKKKAILLFVILLQVTSISFSQTYTSGNPGLFGIDGDINAEKRLNGTFTAAGSHDWFKITAGTGLAIFDTTNADVYKKQMAAGKNIAFDKKMQYGAYTIQNGYLMLDGTYSRDHFGNDTTLDKTIFVASNANNKNHLSPANWVGAKTGDVLPSKSDIADSYIHMRRQGNSIEIGNPSNLIVFLGASTVSTGGDHYIDFELFKTDIKYNSGQGKFVNTGPSATGGRNIWEFNADGSIKTFGEILLSFSFNSDEVSDIGIYIWVQQTTYSTKNPAGFDFVSGSFNGTNGYGYAKIQPNASSILPAWGMVNTTATEAPLWGTTNKENGSQSSNYYYTQYSPGQFAEAAIDLTALGIDPALSTTFDKCTPPYKRVIIKTRSSSSLSSSLQDFAGPFEFLDAPTVPATIIDPGVLTCTNNTLTLKPTDYIIGADYNWSTTDGNIVSTAPDGVVIDKPGTYSLTASLYDGCAPSTKTRTISIDKVAPTAEVTYLGALTTSLLDSIILIADTTSLLTTVTNLLTSSSTTPSSGIIWKWTGPNNFSSDKQKPKTNKSGTYNVTVTEVRNGCYDTKSVTILSYEEATLPLKFLKFNANKQTDTYVLNWQTAVNNEIKLFEVEASINGNNYKKVGYVFADSIANGNYTFKHKANFETAYFRIKAVANNSNYSLYSSTVKVASVVKENQLKAFTDVALKTVSLDYTSAKKEKVELSIYNANGQQLGVITETVTEGNNHLKLPASIKLNSGVYIIVVKGAETTSSTKIIL